MGWMKVTIFAHIGMLAFAGVTASQDTNRSEYTGTLSNDSSSDEIVVLTRSILDRGITLLPNEMLKLILIHCEQAAYFSLQSTCKKFSSFFKEFNSEIPGISREWSGSDILVTVKQPVQDYDDLKRLLSFKKFKEVHFHSLGYLANSLSALLENIRLIVSCDHQVDNYESDLPKFPEIDILNMHDLSETQVSILVKYFSHSPRIRKLVVDYSDLKEETFGKLWDCLKNISVKEMEVLIGIPYNAEDNFRHDKMIYPSSVEIITFTSVYSEDIYFDLKTQIPSQVTRININKMHWPVERLISFPYLEILFGLQVHLPCPEEHLIYFQNKQVSKIVIDSEFEFWDDFPFDHCFEHLVTSPTDFLLTSHLVKAKYIEFKESEAVEWTEVFNLLALNIDLERLKIYVNQDLDLSVLSELKSLNTLEIEISSKSDADWALCRLFEIASFSFRTIIIRTNTYLWSHSDWQREVQRFSEIDIQLTKKFTRAPKASKLPMDVQIKRFLI